MPCKTRKKNLHEDEEHDGWESVHDADVIAAPAIAGQPQEPMDIIDADDNEAVQVAQPLPAPIIPSKAQRDAYDCTHIPYRS